MASVKLMTYEEELKKNPELKESDIQMLREWCAKQPHLPKISDSELALFLHSNYYRLEPTKASMDTFYTVRTHVPEFFSNRDINNKEIRQTSQVVINTVLDGTTREGHKVIYGRLLNDDSSQFIYNDCMKLLNMVIDLWLYTEGTCDGHILIFDMKGVSFGHAGRLSPMGLKKFLYYLQEGLPVRLKGLHFMNTSPVIDVILNMMRPFMKKQLMDMLHVHTASDTLEKFLSLEILPDEAGGQAGSLNSLNDKVIKQFEEYRDWFKTEETHRVDESQRPGKAKTATDLFGVEGSFKKLEID